MNFQTFPPKLKQLRELEHDMTLLQKNRSKDKDGKSNVCRGYKASNMAYMIQIEYLSRIH